MTLSRREFLKLAGSLMSGWAVAMPKTGPIEAMTRILAEINDMGEQRDITGVKDLGAQDSDVERRKPGSPSKPGLNADARYGDKGFTSLTEGDRLLEKIGYFNEINPERFVFDEKKYSPPKRQLDPAEWDRTNRHLPIQIDPDVINKPGQRSPQALKRVVEYTPFNNPRYVAGPGERVTMCNIAAWDWSRALRLHLPHWIGQTEMSANMLFRWILHSQAGGIYGEGWQPVPVRAVQPLANLGIPVFALAENTVKGRHGHVALVYPASRAYANNVGLTFASVSNGRSYSGNGIKGLQSTFRRLKPTYFVHKDDFIVYSES